MPADERPIDQSAMHDTTIPNPLSHLTKVQLQKFIRDFLSYHLSSLRGGSALEISEDDLSQKFTGSPFFMDSLELVTLTGMICDSFRVQETGLEDLFLARPSILQWSELLEKSLELYNGEFNFFSSGSQGKPESTLHRSEDLAEEVGFLAELVSRQLTPRRVISLVPSNHIYGAIFTIFLPQQLGIPVQRVQDISGKLKEGDVVVTIPSLVTQWETRSLSFPRNVLVISSTAPLENRLSQWLTNRGASFLEIYGSSETAGIGYRDTPAAPFTLFPYWERISGTVIQRSSTPKAYPIPDVIQWQDDLRFFPGGRKDRFVQINGINVSPSEIAERFRSHPDVEDAAVRSFSSSVGPRLKIFIRTLRDTDGLEAVLRDWSSRNLPSHQRPAHYSFGTEMPKNSMDKPSDWN